MDKPKRRHYSECATPSTSQTISLVPSHVATKIRGAQLRQKNANRLVSQDEKNISATFSAKVVRNLSGSNFSLKLPKTLPSWRTIQVAAKTQLDGADNFPSIDTILANPDQDVDKIRSKAETEFYEHEDGNGIVRRQSMMRNVSKDDLLRGRGANPRTGLITPDEQSVAGSLDSLVEPREQIKLPSAQWKLKDNQWISEIQGEDKDVEVDQPWIPAVHTEPLTPVTLRSFSHSLHEHEPKHSMQSPSAEAILNVGRIRRKPVGSPSKVTSDVSEARTRRSVSEDTVIRTPPVTHSNHNSDKVISFFSPEDVARVQGADRANRHPRNHCDRLPFLDRPMKPQQTTSTRGFVRGKKNLVQLERCLRTNDGPYLFPPTMPQAIIDQNELRSRPFLPAAPRAYLSDLTNHHGLRQRSRPIYPDTYQNRSLFQGKPATVSSRGLSNRPQIITREYRHNNNATLELPRMNLNISTPNSARQHCRRDIDQILDDQSLSRHDTLPEDNHTIPEGHMHIRHTPGKINGDLVTFMSIARRRPLLGPRANGRASPSTMKSEVAHTVEKSQSNLIGTHKISGVEEAEEGSGTRNADDTLPHPTGSEIPVNLEVTQGQGIEGYKVDLLDHSICCPRCCIEYDCHEGCLGHSPQSEVDTNETSSLLTMGVFEASFETSVKAVNEVLFTPKEERGSAPTKLRQVFLESLCQGSKSSTKEPVKQQPLKRTLRQPSPIRGKPLISNPIIKVKNPRHLDVRQANAAAKKAMELNVIAKHQPKGQRSPKIKDSSASSRNPSAAVGSHPSRIEANEGRKVSAAAIETQYDQDKDLGNMAGGFVEQRVSDIDAKSDAAVSIITKIGALVLDDSVSEPLLVLPSTILKYGPVLLLHFKEMVMVVLDQVTTLSCIICDYKRTGNVVLPDNVSLIELMGSCIWTLMYLMIAACLYALLVKVFRIVLCVLRILLLPIRLCAWVMG